MTAATAERPRLAGNTTEETAVHETNGHAAPAAPEAATETPAADPIPAPSPQELRYLHYQEIVAMGEKVGESYFQWKEKENEAKALKKEYEGNQAMLLRLTRRDPLQRQLTLPNADLAAGGLVRGRAGRAMACAERGCVFAGRPVFGHGRFGREDDWRLSSRVAIARSGSASRPSLYESAALPLCYAGKKSSQTAGTNPAKTLAA